jgi:hypothetical protein
MRIITLAACEILPNKVRSQPPHPPLRPQWSGDSQPTGSTARQVDQKTVSLLLRWIRLTSLCPLIILTAGGSAMAVDTRKVTDSGVPVVTPKLPRELFFNEHERNILGFELHLLVLAAVLAVPFAMFQAFVTSIKW